MLTPARASSATASAARSASAQPTDSAAGSGSRCTEPSWRARICSAAGRCSGSSSRTRSAPDPTDAFSWAGRAFGDHLAVVDHCDALGELVGLLQVLGAEQDRRALTDHRADDVPHLVARARVEPGGGLVEEHQLRRDDDAGRDVEPAAHPAGVVLDQLARRLGEAERLEQLGCACLGGGAVQAQQTAEQDQVLAPGEVLVDRGQLSGEAHQAAHRIGLFDDVVAEHPRAARVGPEQGGEHPDRRRLAGAVGTEHAVDGAAAAPPGRRRRRRVCRRRTSRGRWPRSQVGNACSSCSSCLLHRCTP